MKVMVKDFSEPYGPISTELETLLVLLFPLIGKNGFVRGVHK